MASMKKTDVTSAIAEKTVEEVIDGRAFGNLSKLVLITVPAVAVAVAFVYAVVTGMEYNSLLNALFIIGGGVLAGGTASATTYFGKSQTQLDLQAKRAADTVPVATSAGASVGALPVDSPLVHGNWSMNVAQDDAPSSVKAEEAEGVTSPSFYQTPETVEDPDIQPDAV